MRRLGGEWYDHRIMSKPKWVIWTIYQFIFTIAFLALISYPVWSEIGSSEVVWTDFSPQVDIVTNDYVERNDAEEELLDKDKYYKHFEDKELVIMVLGGIRWWHDNCGTLSGPGNYFMDLAIEKHDINIDELTNDMTYQTGHFAAALYNDCDVFLEQTQSIGLDMMLIKTPQETQLDTVPEVSI